MDTSYDYLIVGGGTAGCVIASRLSLAGNSVALFEVGSDEFSEEVMNPTGAPHLHGTPVEYNYKSVPQEYMNNRQIDNHGGKILSGSTGVNYGLWTRGHSTDYDEWARVVDDDRWSYQSMLKYFKKTETYHDANADSEQHGFNGPISLTAGKRNYPLKAGVLNALTQSGLEFNPDGNAGNPLGVTAFTETWKNGQRQSASLAYDLSKVKVFTNTTVARINIDIDKKTATGVTLLDDTTIGASKEVIVTCGAIKTPQVLMLSGIGPFEHLRSLGISPIIDLPVGQNLTDHISGALFWKLRNPEKGLALGSPLFNDPSYLTGNPMDWISTISVPDAKIAPAATIDGTSVNDLYGTKARAHTEILTAYAPVASAGAGYRLPFDGTHISTAAILLLPTSRGEVTLASTNPTDEPVIDPNYLSTAVDRAILREGVRTALRVMETPAAKEIVTGETPPPGFPQLTSSSSGADIDARIAYVGASFFQNAGTAAMGSVVDTQCRVKGVRGLRVCDASILPGSLAAHYQAAVYAIGEAAADIILEEGAKIDGSGNSS